MPMKPRRDDRELDKFVETAAGDTAVRVELDGAPGTTNIGGKESLDVNVTNITISDVDDTIAIGDGAGNRAIFTDKKAIATGNALVKFRDNFFNATPDLNVWDEQWINQGSSFVRRGGNSSGSGYMQISLDPLTPGSEYVLTSKQAFRYPIKTFSAVSASQRIIGQELEISLVGCDTAGLVEYRLPVDDMPISGTVTITSNVATINFATPHGLTGGDRVIVKGCAEVRLNVGPVIATVVTSTQITVPCTLANGTYTAGGFVEFADYSKNSKNAAGTLFESATATNTSFFTRKNGSSVRNTALTTASTAATQSNTSAYTEAFNSAMFNELHYNMQEVALFGKASDSISPTAGALRYTNTIPDEEISYKIRIRAKNLNNLTVPIAKIVSIAKTGTTTATVTTEQPHGLSTGKYVQIYGVRDQVNFPNLTSITTVASVPSSTTFTIIIGTASTTSSTGGVVAINNGSVGLPGALGVSIQSISRTNNIFYVTLNTTTTVPLPGEYWQIHGCDATSMGLYDGAYKVLRVNGAVLELESYSNPTGADFGAINCGGAVFKRTDYRVHFIQAVEYTRHFVELFNQTGSADGNRALPVLTASSSIISTVSTVASSNAAIPLIVADIASAAITTTATSTAVTPASGTAYSVMVAVTATSGTNQTLDVAIEESDDTGVNWYRVYEFPRITATGAYRSPQLRLRGNRIRYVRTVGGTSPSFTMSLNRLQASSVGSLVAQIVDRTIVPNTLNSASTVLYNEGMTKLTLIVRCTAQTTAATIDLQVSEDGVNWANLGSSVTTIVGTVRSSTVTSNSKFARAIVTSAGTGITLGEVYIKASED